MDICTKDIQEFSSILFTPSTFNITIISYHFPISSESKLFPIVIIDVYEMMKNQCFKKRF